MKIEVLFVRAVVALCFLSTLGCPEGSGSGVSDDCTDGGVASCTTSGPDGIELCVISNEGNFVEFQEFCAEGEVCVKPRDPNFEEELDALCVPGSGGTGGTGGAGGGSGSCLEVDISGLPQIAGTLSISPSDATFDESMIVTADVDADTMEVTASILNENSGVPGGSGSALTSGNETVEVNVRVETVAQPGPHVLELELRADPLNRLDYVRYTPGDGDTYVIIEFENNVPGPETDTTCLVVNATIQ